MFTAEELVGNSITGKQSNALKEKEARPQLDTIRVNAVVREYYFFAYSGMESDEEHVAKDFFDWSDTCGEAQLR